MIQFAAAALALGFVSHVAAPGRRTGQPHIVQPTTYSSPSGEWSLYVDPSARSGKGPGRYRLSQAGEVAWEAELPYTLREAVVLDEGTFGGYAYTHGPEGRSFRDYGEFIVAIRDAGGRKLCEERTVRKPSCFLHGTPRPEARGVFAHAPWNAMVVRLRVEREQGGDREAWWQYDLSDGSSRHKGFPVESSEGSSSTKFVDAVQPLPDTPLVLTHRLDFGPVGSGKAFSHFKLLDRDRRPVWGWTRMHDRTRLSDEDRDAIRGGAAIHEVRRDQIQVQLVPERQRISFSVDRDPSSETGWTVAELGRWDYQLPPAPPEPAPPPSIELEEVGSFPLVVSRASAGPIRNIAAFDFDEHGTLRFIRREEEKFAFSFVRVTEAGDLLEDVRMQFPERELEGRIGWYPMRAPLWLATLSPFGPGAKAQAWIVNPAEATWSRLDALRAPAVDDVAMLPDGGFVLLGTYRSKYTMTDSLSTHDANGARRWRVGQNYQDPTKLFGPEAIAVQPDGSIVVLDNTRKLLQVFEGSGEHRTNVDLEGAWGQEPNYPSGIISDALGGLLIHDFNGTPPLWRMNAEGVVQASMTPTMPDGSPAPELARYVRYAPDGRLWTTDRELLFRLDGQARVEHVIGELPLDEEVNEAESAFIGPLGHFAVLDARTSTMHFFDPTGAHRGTWTPEEPPPVYERFGRNFAVDSTGGCAHFEGKETQVHDADGTLRYQYEPRAGSVAFPPTGALHWAAHQDLMLVDAGGTVHRRISRRLDNTWLAAETLDCAPDGRVAVSDGAGVHVFSPEGDPIRRYELAHGFVRIGFGRDWIAGARWDENAHLICIDDGSVRAFQVPGASDGEPLQLDASPDGTELWVVDLDELVVHRFALP